MINKLNTKDGIIEWLENHEYNAVRKDYSGFTLAGQNNESLNIFMRYDGTAYAFITIDLSAELVERLNREALLKEKSDIECRLNEIEQELNK